MGSQNVNNHQSNPRSDFAPPDVPVLIHHADGIRVLLGTHDLADRSKADIQIERRKRGWAIFLHPNAGDPVGYIFILDDGQTFLLPEQVISDSIEVVDQVPPTLDGP
jgi:hypothetical protein